MHNDVSSTSVLPARPRWRSLVLGLSVVATALTFGACEDDPFGFNNWESFEDTVQLFSLARPELNLPSAYNFNRRSLHQVEAANASGQWDVALDTRGGQLVLLAPRVLGIDGQAGIAPLPNESFETIVEAPADSTLYITSAAVPVVTGQLYVIRTNQGTGSFGQRCTYYAKMEPLSADAELGLLEFRLDSNPICNSRDLIPPAN